MFAVRCASRIFRCELSVGSCLLLVVRRSLLVVCKLVIGVWCVCCVVFVVCWLLSIGWCPVSVARWLSLGVLSGVFCALAVVCSLVFAECCWP